MMLDLLVHQFGVGSIGDISEYQSLEIERNYHSVSKLVLRVPKNSFNANLLKLGNLISTYENPYYMYYIDHFSAIKEGKNDIIEVYAYSLNYLLSFRTLKSQMTFSGKVEAVVKSFIDYNAVNTESSRVIPNLSLDTINSINNNVIISRTGGDLMTTSFEILKEYESSIDILMDDNIATNMKLYTWQGEDRSIEQNINPHVIFSSEYDNVLQQNYFTNKLDYKNVTLVAGEGEGVDRKIEEVVSGSTPTGLNRRELYVDARDLQSKYYDEDGIEKTLTPAQYEETLVNRGLEALKEKNIVESFESVVDDVQYILGKDYYLGDKVTFVDEDLNIIKSVRVTSIKTVSNSKGVIHTPSFGTGIPNKLMNKEV